MPSKRAKQETITPEEELALIAETDDVAEVEDDIPGAAAELPTTRFCVYCDLPITGESEDDWHAECRDAHQVMEEMVGEDVPPDLMASEDDMPKEYTPVKEGVKQMVENAKRRQEAGEPSEFVPYDAVAVAHRTGERQDFAQHLEEESEADKPAEDDAEVDATLSKLDAMRAIPSESHEDALQAEKPTETDLPPFDEVFPPSSANYAQPEAVPALRPSLSQGLDALKDLATEKDAEIDALKDCIADIETRLGLAGITVEDWDPPDSIEHERLVAASKRVLRERGLRRK